MTTPAVDIEEKYLIASCVGNVIIGCVGIVCAAISSSQAILLDGLFNLLRDWIVHGEGRFSGGPR